MTPVTDADILAALDIIAAVQVMAHDEDVSAGLSKTEVRTRQMHFVSVRARIAAFLSSPESRNRRSTTCRSKSS